MHSPPIQRSICVLPPPQVLPVGIGVADVFCVLIVPLLVIVDRVPSNWLATMFSVPPDVVVRVVAVMAPAAVSVFEVLLKLIVPYVPSGTYWAPVRRAKVTAPVVPVQVSPDGMAGLETLEVVTVPLLVTVMVAPNYW